MTDEDGEVRELTSGDLAHFRSMPEVLAPSLIKKLGVQHHQAQKASVKARTTIRSSQDVLDRFRATGPGWRARIDAALREWLENQRG